MEHINLRYRNLTPEEKKLVSNGCGGKGWKITPPTFMFEASCDHHDFNYWRGCTEEDRLKYDRGFYNAMKRDAGWCLFHRMWAWIYYRAVRAFGHKFFNYSETQKTWEDFHREFES